MRQMSRVLKAVFMLSISYALLMGATASGQLAHAQGAPLFANQAEKSHVNRLIQLTEGNLRIKTHAFNGKARFIGTVPLHAIAQPSFLGVQQAPEVVARRFLSEYGSLFGLKDQARSLKVIRSKTVGRKRSFVRFQQVYSDLPVFGGELIIQADAHNNILSANGEISPEISIDTAPDLSAAEAQAKAIGFVLKRYGPKYNIERASLVASEPELWIYNPVLLGMNRDFNHLVWRLEVFPKEMLPFRELILVDAHLGTVVLHFNQIATAKNREVYDHKNLEKSLPGDPSDLCRSEGDSPSGITDCDNAYDYAGDAYDFYMSHHDRDSIDNKGMKIISTVRYCDPKEPCPLENAYWNGSQMAYGEGVPAADDVVGHEFTHGVTEFESKLFYFMQSGAIDEVFADIWGEFVDLTNGAGSDDLSDKWLIGEDSPSGAFRSMKDPPNPPSADPDPQPDRMGSPLYACDLLDDGGVHTNNGVGNKAAYLMTDGGSFNGYTISGLGIEKVAKLFYEVQINLFTSASDYQDLSDALEQAAINLGFNSSDRQQIQKAINATEMDQQPASCPAPDAPVCDSGSSADLFFDDLENVNSGNWTHGANVGEDVWELTSMYCTSGQNCFWGEDQGAVADIYMAMTRDVPLPTGSAPYMHFRHSYFFEMDFDGGVIEYSTDGGTTWNDAGSLITDNQYSGIISSGHGNPLGGRQAFVDQSSLGAVYISSRLDLSSLAGQKVRFRFRIGTDNDNANDADGWYIDDIRIYTCEGTKAMPWIPLLLLGE